MFFSSVSGKQKMYWVYKLPKYPLKLSELAFYDASVTESSWIIGVFENNFYFVNSSQLKVNSKL